MVVVVMPWLLVGEMSLCDFGHGSVYPMMGFEGVGGEEEVFVCRVVSVWCGVEIRSRLSSKSGREC